MTAIKTAPGAAMRPRRPAPGTRRAPAGSTTAVRVGPIAALPSLLSQLGVDPATVMTQAGVDPRVMDDPENWIATDRLGVVLKLGARAANCEHLGLLLGDPFTLNSMGALGYLMRHSATPLDALRSLLVHMELQDRASVTLMLDPDAPQVSLGYTLIDPEMAGRHQYIDAVITMAHRLLAELCGPGWRPLSVMLARPRPPDASPYERVFGCRPKFGAAVSAVVFDARWLRHPIAGADARLHRILARAVELMEAGEPLQFEERVQRAIRAMILTSAVSSSGIASFFGLHERTLRRRLASEGTGVRALIDDERRRLAQELLRTTRLPVSEISAILHYSDPTAFARAFRKAANMSPRQWRASGGRAACRRGAARRDRVATTVR